MLQKKLAKSFARNKKSSFWSDVRKLKNSSHPVSPVVDGVAGSKNIANVFASKIESILNYHSPSSHSSPHSSIRSSVTPSDISSIEFNEDDVLEVLSHLKTGKSDGDGVSAEHVIFATSAKSLSNSFSVSNGVRQGGVLSPILFSLYLDGLLQKLADSGAGCHWGHLFAGAVCYADDIVLLAPCPSALRILLNICSTYASTHGLRFNAEKTQLICFYLRQSHPVIPTVVFNNVVLQYSNEVTHLGHILTPDLDDKNDIIRAVKDLNRKANSLFLSFVLLIHL